MHLQFWKQFCWLAAGLPVAAWCMYVAMRFLIFACAGDILQRYQHWNEASQMVFIIVELGFFIVFNKLRLHVVKEAYLALVPAIHRRFSIVQVYATILWVVCMFSLLQHLWAALPVFRLDTALQFLLLVLGLSNMMGIALPFSALRGWVFVWYRRKLDKLS